VTFYHIVAMPKRLECFIEGCDATIEADSEAEVMAQVEAHAGDAHPDLELDEETVNAIQEQIRDV
jgi:predicted small metal-binding protein